MSRLLWKPNKTTVTETFRFHRDLQKAQLPIAEIPVENNLKREGDTTRRGYEGK